MANIDYREAKKEIENIFSRKDGAGRQVIFWYDAAGVFKEDIAAEHPLSYRLFTLEHNEFALKKIIEHDDPTSDFLIYIPYERPVDAENWLLDILMYSREYYADTTSLTMRRLGLSDIDLRRVIERYTKFFDSETRIEKLKKHADLRDGMDPDELKKAMMCVLAKAPLLHIESILTELVFDNDGTRLSELMKFGFEEYLWDQISQNYNYDGDQSIASLIKRFMFSAFMEQGVDIDSLPSYYEQFLLNEAGTMDARYFVDKIKYDKRYLKLQEKIAEELKIDGLLAPRDLTAAGSADVFENVDIFIIRKIAGSLRNGSLDYDTFDRVISGRVNSMWYEKHKAEYSLLKDTMALFRMLDKPIPKGLDALEYIERYTEEYYLYDTYYRHICISYKEIEHPDEDFEWLMELAENSYRNKFLDVIGKEYSDAVRKQGKWSFPGIAMANDFYNEVQKKNYKKCFVIISDGFRYELGRELYGMIRSDSILKGTEEIKYMISPLPSETRFGMASLLPHRIMAYADKLVTVDSRPTNSTALRDEVLKAKDSSYAAITYDEINNMKRADLRSYMADKSLVYIYHDTVDNAGEHNESKVFDVTPDAIKEILQLIRKLYNSLQISNFYVTADHGFIYRRGDIEESQKYSDIVSLKPLETAKRYLLTDDPSMNVSYTLEFDLDEIVDGNYKIITPYGYDLFKTQGGGLHYVHGGASLQETVVPVIHIGELSVSKGKEDLSPVGVRLKSVTRKITNRQFSLEFEQYEKVGDRKEPVTCETYIIDDEGSEVSGKYIFTAMSTSDDPESRVTVIRFLLSNIEFDRNKRYYLVLRDKAKQNEYIEKEQFTIDILKFKMF